MGTYISRDLISVSPFKILAKLKRALKGIILIRKSTFPLFVLARNEIDQLREGSKIKSPKIGGLNLASRQSKIARCLKTVFVPSLSLHYVF